MKHASIISLVKTP